MTTTQEPFADSVDIDGRSHRSGLSKVKIFLLIIVANFIFVSSFAIALLSNDWPLYAVSKTKSAYPTSSRVEHDPNILEEEEVDLNSITNNTKVVETETEAQIIARAELVDKKYCGKSPCDFFFMPYVHEQESKAQWQVRNGAFLSGLLNRTFVLPQVSGSRFGACQRFSFFNYFSPSFLISHADDFSYITHDNFLSWTREYPSPLTTQFVYMHKADLEDNLTANLPPMAKLSGNVCSRELGLNFAYDSYENPLVIFKVKNYWQKYPGKTKEMLDQVLAILTDPVLAFGKTNETKGSMAKVLLLETRLAWKPFVPNPAALEPLEYNTYLQNVAKNISSQLSPYTAIQWRMETIPAENMPQCARDLVTTVRELGVANIYLATDYPIQAGSKQPNSDTFFGLKAEHDEAINIITEAFPNITWSYLVNNDPLSKESPANQTVSAATSLPNPSQRINAGGIPVVIDKDFDSGYLSIVDKLVCANAKYFVAAPRKTCARSLSSYTSQIIHMRKAKKHGPKVV